MIAWRRSLNPLNWSITVKLSAALLLAALLPISTATVYNLRRSLDSIKATEYKNLELLAVSTSSRLDQMILDTRRAVEQLSKDQHVIEFLSTPPDQREPLRPDIDRVLVNLRLSNEEFFDLTYVIDADGKAVAAPELTRILGVDYQFREYFQVPKETGQSYVSSILVGTQTREPGLYFSAPVFSDDNTFLGIVVLKMDGKAIWEIVDSLDMGANGGAFLIDKDGVVIAHPDRDYLYHSLDLLPPDVFERITTDRGDGTGLLYGTEEIPSLNIPELYGAMVGAAQPGHLRYYFPGENQWKIAGFAPMSNQDWVMGVTETEEAFSAPLKRLALQNVISVLVIGGITTAVALRLAQSIVRPIQALTETARGLEQDEFDAQLIPKAERSLLDISQHPDIIAFLTALPLERDVHQLAVRKQLEGVQNSIKTCEYAYILNSAGLCLIATDPSLEGSNYRHRPYFRKVLREQVYISPKLLMGALTKRPGIFFATSIRDDKKLIGVFVIKLVNQSSYVAEVTSAARTKDDIGQLAGVFLRMAAEVKAREEKLKQQVAELRIEIDQTKKARQVAEITDTDFFKDLQKKAKGLRRSKSQEPEQS
jgi:C4-dicarboxylate-specific signal transduction histidine kinase